MFASKLFADDEKSERCFRMIDIEKGFITKITTNAHEYELTIDGVEETNDPDAEIDALAEDLKKVKVSDPIRK